MIAVLWRLTRGYRLRPWRSPYLRWRIETYQGWHADEIGFRRFCAFAWSTRRELIGYLQWAAENGRRSVAGHPFSATSGGASAGDPTSEN